MLYNCANPGDYTQWEKVWPPLAAALLTTAERTGAVYAITGNLYPYGPVDGPMTEDLPDAATDHKGVLRARLWADALAAHRARPRAGRRGPQLRLRRARGGRQRPRVARRPCCDAR